MDDLQFFLDDESLLNYAENFDMDEEFPKFEIDEIQIDSFDINPQVPSTGPPSDDKIQGCEFSPDQSRFPVFTDQDIKELKENTTNKNTERSTRQWMAVFDKWRLSRNLEIEIINMAPVELDKVLGQFYAEVKKKDGEDYEPECLKIMQSAIERYLKSNNYPVSIVRGREFDNSQKILQAKAICLRQQGKGKRPNKSQPLTSDELSALWMKGELGDGNGRVLTNTNFKILSEQLGLRGRQDHYDAYVEDFRINNT